MRRFGLENWLVNPHHIGKYSLSEMPPEELFRRLRWILNKAPIEVMPTNPRPAWLEADYLIVVLTGI